MPVLGHDSGKDEFNDITDETNFNAQPICSEIQIKLEPELDKNNYSDSNFSVNPWDVSNSSVFLSYCCPECDFKSGELLGFSQHAVLNHVLSHTLFFTKENSLIENDNNPEVNSTKARLKYEDCIDDPLFEANLDNYDSYIDPSVEHIDKVHEQKKSTDCKKENALIYSDVKDGINAEINLKNLSNHTDRNIVVLVEKKETMESETNSVRNSNEKKTNFDSLKNNFTESTVKLDNQSGESGEKLKEKRTAICEICGFKSSPQGLLKHVQMMHEKSFKCLFCESKFAQERQLEYHIEAKHPGTSELKYFCSECGDGFMFERNMIKHSEKHKKTDELVHEREKGHKCSICHKIFSRKFCLQKHIKTVHEIQKESLQKLMKTVPVNLNNFSKKAQDIFKESLDTSGDKNDNDQKEAEMLKTDPADNKFQNSDEKELKDEGNTEVQNLDKTNQLCAKCGQHFTSLIDLVHHFFKEHKKPGEDFDCPMCPKIISLKYPTSKASVMEHMRNTHLKETRKCPICKQIFKLSHYKKHRRQVHGIHLKRPDEKLTPAPNPDGQYECPACKKVLSTKRSKYF